MPVAFLVVTGCNSIDLNPFVRKEVKQGQRLAQVYCKSCHQFPEPDLLDKKTWSLYVLPKMGSFLGFMRFETGNYIESGKGTMKLDDWKKIMAYYTSQSPEEPVKRKKNIISTKTGIFKVEIPSFSLIKPATTFVRIDEAGHQFFFGDGQTGRIYALSKEYLVRDSFPVNEGIAGMQINTGNYRALSMGVLHPSDEKKGKLEVIDPFTKTVHTLLDSLQRPVHASYADLNGDGKEDIVVCEFGNLAGSLSWYEATGHEKYSRHVLRALPGAIRSQVYDFDHDGRLDIIALMAQGDEGLFIYYNQGNGQFNEQRILRLAPSYGSNYFELADFNKDGFQDILATNGDNGDYPPISKAYHGIRIYLNDGKNHFSEKVFLPVYGVGKAVAKDFDGDGDLDISSISYFPDYDHSPEEAFIYWENKGGLSFTPSTFKEANAGRWLTMDAGDMDGDGDQDIILGNAFFSLGYVPEKLKTKWEHYTPSVLVLKNMLH